MSSVFISDHRWFSYHPDLLFHDVLVSDLPQLFYLHILSTVFELVATRRAASETNVGSALFVPIAADSSHHSLFRHCRYALHDTCAFFIAPRRFSMSNACGANSLNPFYPGLEWWILVYLTPLLLLFTFVTTFGIQCAWILTSIILAVRLRRVFNLSYLRIALIITGLFHVMYWPVYRYYFVFDNLFKSVAGITGQNHWGYGSYFMLASFLGAMVYRHNSAGPSSQTHTIGRSTSRDP